MIGMCLLMWAHHTVDASKNSLNTQYFVPTYCDCVRTDIQKMFIYIQKWLFLKVFIVFCIKSISPHIYLAFGLKLRVWMQIIFDIAFCSFYNTLCIAISTLRISILPFCLELVVRQHGFGLFMRDTLRIDRVLQCSRFDPAQWKSKSVAIDDHWKTKWSIGECG